MYTTANEMADYLRSTLGDRAANTYLGIISKPLNEIEFKREQQLSNTEIMLEALESKVWWKTTELRKALSWDHNKTTQTLQYLIRTGKVQKSGKKNRVQYRKIQPQEQLELFNTEVA